jgi:hypothetical protein
MRSFDRFTVKYYPPPLLILIVLFIVGVKFAFEHLFRIWLSKPQLPWYMDLVSICTSLGIVTALLRIINQKVDWNWLLKIMGVHKISGSYKGSVISSYHLKDNTKKPHVHAYCAIDIAQNLNGFFVKGKFYSDAEMTEGSSEFESEHEQIEKLPTGAFRIHYFYKNLGNKLHPNEGRYGLDTHNGVCVLEFDPKTKTMRGYYFNRERDSHGQIKLSQSDKTIPV